MRRSIVAFAAFSACACAISACRAPGPVRLLPPPPGEPLHVPPTDPTFVQVNGRVLDARGAPIAGADVLVMGGGRTGVRARSSATGEFAASGLPPTSEGYVIVLAPKCAVAVREPVEISQRTTQSITLRLEPEHVLAGRVVAVEGTPVVHARVEVRGERKLASHARKNVSWERAAQIDTQWTDADGRFRFAQLYAGEFDVEATDADRSATARASAGDEAIELRLLER